MSPEGVMAFLAERASKVDGDLRWNDTVHEIVESALVERREPLIDLALARYGRYAKTVTGLFRKHPPSSAIRLAVLSNRVAPADMLSSFPVPLFGGEQQVLAWVRDAPEDELIALFDNPNVGDRFLLDVLSAQGEWEQVGTDRLATIVQALHRNSRMWTPYDDSYMDGFADYQHHAVFDAAWSLAERMPVTPLWAASLQYLFAKLEPKSFSVKTPLEVAERWRPDPTNGEALQRENEASSAGYLSEYQRVRKGLAHLALAGKASSLPMLLSHDDLAFRAAAYHYGNLSPEQLRAAYERDGELAFTEAVDNEHLWRTREARESLREVAWDVTKHDKHSDLLAANIFNGREEHYRKMRPDWFTDEHSVEGEPNSDSEAPATKADLAQLFAAISQLDSNQRLGLALDKLNKRMGWIFWFSLLAAAGVFGSL